jgi:hypothetical protein
MPNWCKNNVTFCHSDRSKIKELFISFYKHQALFELICPIPQVLKDTNPNTFSDKIKQQEQLYKEEEKYLTSSQKESLWRYKDMMSDTINSYFRENIKIDPYFESIDKNLTTSMETLENIGYEDAKIVLYRGLKGIPPSDNSSIITETAFSSCTTDVNIAKGFTNGTCCVLKFILPKNILFYKYSGLFGWDDAESEYLLERSLQYVIVSNNKDGYITENGVITYLCIVKKYNMPEITEEDEKNICRLYRLSYVA